MTQRSVDLRRPATAFLSYKRENADEVKYLQRLLHVRGVRAWRDGTNLELGQYSEDAIVRAIKDESDAFVLYITPKCLTSKFIWEIEVPAALERWQHDRRFGIVPILRGVSVGRLRRFCEERGIQPSLTDFNGVPIAKPGAGQTSTGMNEALREIAKRALSATLRLRLQRAGADRGGYEARICLHTFHYEPRIASLDLDLNWTEFFPSRDKWPPTDEWQAILLPALFDVKDVMSDMRQIRIVHMIVQARLPAAFALGFIFPSTSHFTLVLEGKKDTWSTAAVASEKDPLLRDAEEREGDKNVAVVEIAISRRTAEAVADSLPALGLSFRHHIQFRTPGEQSNDAVKDAAHAQAMAQQIARELKTLCDRERVSQIHLFLACPAELAVLLGHQLNALRSMALYHYLDAEGVYKPTYTLNPLGT